MNIKNPYNRNALSLEREKLILKLNKDGIKICDIARRLGMTPRGVRIALSRATKKKEGEK